MCKHLCRMLKRSSIRYEKTQEQSVSTHFYLLFLLPHLRLFSQSFPYCYYKN